MNKNTISITEAEEIWKRLTNQPFPKIINFQEILLYHRLKNFITDFVSWDPPCMPPGWSIQREIVEEDAKIDNTTILAFMLNVPENRFNFYILFYYFYNEQFIPAIFTYKSFSTDMDITIMDVNENIRGEDSLFIAYDCSW